MKKNSTPPATLTTLVLIAYLGISAAASANPPVAIRNAEEIYAGLAGATGVSPADEEVRTYFKTVQGRLPRNGVVTETTAPMRFAYLGLSEKFCSKMINQEFAIDDLTARRILKTVDVFSDVSQFTPSVISATVGSLFTSFLNRAPSTDENAILADTIHEYQEISPTEKDIRPLLTMVCAAVATSPEFLIF